MRLTFETNDNTGRFVVKSDGERLLFETYHLAADERVALTNALRLIEDAMFSEGFGSARRQAMQFLEGLR